jgi:amidophosphoribosyltransferase
MAGLFGAYSGSDRSVLEEVYLGLYALQHRGQQSAGIAWMEGGRVFSAKGLGLLHNAIKQKELSERSSSRAIGHVRNKPIDASLLQSVMPLCANYARGPVAMAQDGLVTNSPELTAQLERHGAIFQSSASSEVILHMMAQNAHMQPIDSFTDSLRRLEGAFSILITFGGTLVAARDPWGFMPLLLGYGNETHYVASESCALDIVGAETVREIEPGEIVVIDERGVRSLRIQREVKKHMKCAFEYVYKARPDSVIGGRPIYEARKEMGQRLAEKSPCNGADMVCGMPDSGTTAAMGYAEKSKQKLEMAVVRNRYVGHSFLRPTLRVRELGVKVKLNPVPGVFKGKTTVVVDDSIVRGTTAERAVSMIKDSGAASVHLRIASPPVRYECPYGVGLGYGGHLAAVEMNSEELLEKIGADSIGYLSIEDLIEAIGLPEHELCTACFTGKGLESDK